MYTVDIPDVKEHFWDAFMMIALSLFYGSVKWMSVMWFAQSGEYICAFSVKYFLVLLSFLWGPAAIKSTKV